MLPWNPLFPREGCCGTSSSPLTELPCPPGWWMTAVWWNLQQGTWTTPLRSSEVRHPLPLSPESWIWA